MTHNGDDRQPNTKENKSHIQETLNISWCADSTNKKQIKTIFSKKRKKNNMSPVTCPMPRVTCQVWPVTCHLSPTPKATTTNFPTMHSWLIYQDKNFCLGKPKLLSKKIYALKTQKLSKPLKNKCVSLFCSFSNTPFEQKRPVHVVRGSNRWQKHTDTTTDIVTYRLNWPRGRSIQRKVEFDRSNEESLHIEWQPIFLFYFFNLLWEKVPTTVIKKYLKMEGGL